MDICLHTIFQISDNYIGGTERFLISYAKELKNLGYNAFIVCSNFIESYTVEGVQVYGVIPQAYKEVAKTYDVLSSKFINHEFINKYTLEKSLQELSKYIEEQLHNINADYIHLNSFVSAAYVNPMNAKYLVYNHENDRELDSCYGDGFFMRFSDLVFKKKTNLHRMNLYTPSLFYSQFFQERLGCQVNNIGLGINLIDFRYSEKLDVLKKDIWSDSSGYIILLPSRFKIEQKGHDIALKAIKLIVEKGIKIKLLITGVKSHELYKVQDFMNYASEIEVHKHIIISSYDDINIAYQNCDCVISPERYCSYGLSISESLSLGIPTIINTIPTYIEIGTDYNHAYFFQTDDYIDLSNTIIELIESKKLIRNRVSAIKFRQNNDIRECAKLFSQYFLSSFINH